MGELRFVAPVNEEVGDPYGTLRKRKNKKTGEMEYYDHSGIDYKAETGTSVQASESGLVLRASLNESGGYGNVIVIYHNPGALDSGETKDRHIYTLYAHLSEMYVQAGGYVEKYETIGASGNTGRSTGPHLHFEVIEANTELGWATEGSMGVESGGSIRKNPDVYFDKTDKLEGTLPDIVEQAILDRIEFVPDTDLKLKDPSRLEVYLDGKNIGYLNKDKDTVGAAIKYDLKEELQKIWRKPLRVPENKPIGIEYE